MSSPSSIFVSSTWEALKAELVDKVVYDDIRVFTAIRKGDVDTRLLDRCYVQFLTDRKVQEAIKGLRELECLSSTYSPEDDNHIGRDKDMYPYLVRSTWLQSSV